MRNMFLFNPTKESIAYLSKIRIIQKNLIHVQGLPKSLANADILKSNEYFGQYGQILKIFVAQKTNPDNNKKLYSAYITYSNEIEAASAILCVDSLLIETKIIRVFFGTTKYCGFFLNNIQCPNPNKCSFLHKIATDKDIIIKDNSNFSYDDHINLSKKIIQSSNLKTFLNKNNNKKSTVLPPVDFIFLSEEEKQNYFASKNIRYIKNIETSNNNIYLNDFNEQLNNFDFNFFSSNLNNNIQKKNLNENLNVSSNSNKNNKSSNTFRININNIPMESYELHNIFKNSIKHILKARPFYSKLKNVPLTKMEFEYLKKDLSNNGRNIYEVLDGCLDCVNNLFVES